MKNLRMLLLPLCAAACLAQTPSVKERKVEEIFKLAQMDSVLKQSIEMAGSQMQNAALQQLLGIEMTPKQRQIVDEFRGKINAVVAQGLSWDKIKPGFVKLYVDAFTEDELDGMIAFYRSPAGQAMVAKTPKLMSDASAITQERMLAMQSDVRRLMDDLHQRLNAESSADTPAK
jgi:hypothetical protein